MFVKAIPIQIFVFLFSIVSYADNSIPELISKLQENQKNFTKYGAKSVFTAEINTGQDTSYSHEETEIFIDNNRIDFRKHQWSNLNSMDQATPLENAVNRSFMWDGSSFYIYVKQQNYDGILHLQSNDDNKNEMLSTGYEGTPLIGIFKGDQESIDSILRKAKNISIENQLEKIGEAECYVINAQTDHGEYRVWIDPEHGYNIVKAKVSKKKGDILWGKPLGWQGDTTNLAPSDVPRFSGYRFDMSNVCFEKISDKWIPVEADYETFLDYSGRITIVKMHHKQTHTELNPDFKAANAFVPDIPNGTPVFIEEQEKTYFWQYGKITVDKQPISIMGKTLPDFNGININLIQNQLANKMMVICFFDYEQRPSRNCLMGISKKAHELKAKDIEVVAVQASKIEKAKLDDYIRENSISFPVGMIEKDEEKIRFNWGVKALPWLIITDKKQIVTAEGFSVDDLDNHILKSGE